MEGVFCRTANGEADPVDGDATLIDREIAVLDHLLRTLVLEGILVASLLVLNGDADGRLVNVSLHDVSVQATVHQHRALHVHFVAHSEQPEIAALQRLAHGCYRVGGLTIGLWTLAIILRRNRAFSRGRMVNGYDGQANAVMGDALVDAEFVYERASQSQMDVVLVVFYGDYPRHAFNDSGKHCV